MITARGTDSWGRIIEIRARTTAAPTRAVAAFRNRGCFSRKTTWLSLGDGDHRVVATTMARRTNVQCPAVNMSTMGPVRCTRRDRTALPPALKYMKYVLNPAHRA